MSKINVNVSGTKNILFWKKEYSKDIKISSDDFFALQRLNLFSDNAQDNKNGSISYQNTTFTFSDQESINNALWTDSDLNRDGNLDKAEYKQLLAKTVSSGVIGDVDGYPSTSSGLVMPIGGNMGMGFGLCANDIKELIPNYEELLETCEVYSALKSADEGVDINGDGLISREEFNNSILTKLTTEAEMYSDLQSPYADILSDDDKINILGEISEGKIANVYNRTVAKTGPVIPTNGSGVKVGISYAQETVINPDYETLIDVAEKYNEKMSNIE